MTDPTKKYDSAQTSDKAKAVKSAMTGTSGADATSPPAGKPMEPVKGPPKPDTPPNAAPKPAPASTVKPAEAGKESPKPTTASSAAAIPAAPARDPSKGSVPPSPPTPSGPTPSGPASSGPGGTQPPRGPGGPQGPGAPQGPSGPKGPGTPPPGAAAKAPQPKRPAATPKKKRGCLGTLIWLVVIVAALAAGAYYTWPYWPDVVKRPVEAKFAEVIPEVQTPEEKAALEDRLTKYDSRLAALESKVADVAERNPMTEADVKAPVEAERGTGDANAETNAQVSALTSRLDALESALATVKSSDTADTGAAAAVGASVHALSERIAQLETDLASAKAMESRLTDMEERAQAEPSGEAKAAVVLAVSNLEHAVMSGGPFASELNSLKAVAGDDAALTGPIGELEPQAASGIPTLIELRAQFPAVADEVSRVYAEWTGEDWVDKALSRVTSLVSVRKTGEDAVAAKGTDGALAQADAALAEGDVAAAVKLLEDLEGPPAKAAAPWLSEARKRLAAEAALKELRQRAIALLAAGG